jgi:hypothetical protein
VLGDFFQRKHWRDHLDYVPAQMRCTGYGRRGVPVRLSREAPIIVHLPMPQDGDWNRAVSRFRA